MSGIIAIPLSGVGSTGGTSSPGVPPNNAAILSVSVLDVSGQKQITVLYAPPSPIGTFTGVWVYLDAPDSAYGLSIADGTVPADGNAPATGIFQPKLEGFFPYDPNSPQIAFSAPSPATPEQWRVYLIPGSRGTQLYPIQAGLPGASINEQFYVPPQATLATGREYAPNVLNAALGPASDQGWTANPNIVVMASGDQFFQLYLTWDWPTGDQNFSSLAAVSFLLSDGLSSTETYYFYVLSTSPPICIIPHIPIRPGTTDYTMYLLSADINHNSNQLVPGVTPQVTFSVTQPLGAAGTEYCHLVESDGVHPFVTASPVTNAADGTAQLKVDGYYKNIEPTDPLYDPRFGGAEIVVDKADGNGPIWSVAKGTIGPIEGFITNPSTVQTWTFYLRSIDINGRPNTIVPGTTPSVAISVGSATGLLNLAQAKSTSYSTEFTISSGALRINQLSATTIVTGQLQVGGGGGKVSEFKIFDTLGSLIGWIGDDTLNSGYVGAWFKQIRIGGTSPSTAPLVADSSGNLAITNAAISVTGSGVTTSMSGSIGGIQMTGSGLTGAFSTSNIQLHNGSLDMLRFLYDPTGVNHAFFIQSNSGSNVTLNSAGEISIGGPGSVNAILMNGVQVLGTRQTGPGNASGFADSVAQTWANNLLTALRAHGLVT